MIKSGTALVGSRCGLGSLRNPNFALLSKAFICVATTIHRRVKIGAGFFDS